jgi:hypothetical protein
MIQRIAQLSCFAALLAAMSLSAAAQNVWVRGICRGKDGEHIAGGMVEFQNLASGNTITVITGERGEYSTMDVVPGTYKVTLTGPDNRRLFSFDRMTFQPDSQYNVDFDLAALPAGSGKQSGSPALHNQSENTQQGTGKSRAPSARFQPLRGWPTQASLAG